MQPGKVISVFKSVHTYNSGNKRKKCSSKTIWKIKIFYNATIKTKYLFFTIFCASIYF